MADRRDAGVVRSLHFKEIQNIMNDIGPGDPDADKVVHVLDVQISRLELISRFTSVFISTMYFDLQYPSYFTPHKILQWKDIATMIYKDNNKEDVKRTFSRISRQLGLCEKKLTDLIHYESKPEELQYALYDFILRLSMDNNIDLKGLLPKK